MIGSQIFATKQEVIVQQCTKVKFIVVKHADLADGTLSTCGSRKEICSEVPMPHTLFRGDWRRVILLALIGNSEPTELHLHRASSEVALHFHEISSEDAL